MAVTVQTILRSAKSRGSFIGVTLQSDKKDYVLEGVVKVKRVSPQYVELVEFDGRGRASNMKVHKGTILQVRHDGMVRSTRNTRSRA